MKKTLTMDGTTARKIYPTATSELKAILDDSFGTEFFSQDIKDRIKTLEDAYEAIGKIRPDEEVLLKGGVKPHQIIENDLEAIAEALNEGWTADMYDTTQYKYWPWFEVRASSFVFGDAYCADSIACAGSASRLCFKSAELARYAGKTFTALYEAQITK